MNNLLGNGSFGKTVLQDIAGKSAIVFQNGTVCIVSNGFVSFTSFQAEDILAFAKEVEVWLNFQKEVQTLKENETK